MRPARSLRFFPCEEEGTASSFRGLSETIRGYGLFSSFYTDRGSHYFTTPKVGEKVDKAHLMQVGLTRPHSLGSNSLCGPEMTSHVCVFYYRKNAFQRH
jgi:hypothetical protein